MVSLRLRELSDMEGDVGAYIAAVEAGGRAENVVADIAERLIAHQRPAEALAWLDRAAARHDEARQIDLRIATLDALGRKTEAQDLRDRGLALAFLVARPNLKAANQVVRDHHDKFDGREYFRLRPAAEALAEKYPASATLLHRALAEDVLRRASSRQYPYAARDVRACENLAMLLPDEAGLETHEAFMARLLREHPRKTGFWPLLAPGVR